MAWQVSVQTTTAAHINESTLAHRHTHPLANITIAMTTTTNTPPIPSPPPTTAIAVAKALEGKSFFGREHFSNGTHDYPSRTKTRAIALMFSCK